MTLGPNARNAILWVVIAILSYFCLEMLSTGPLDLPSAN